VRQPEGSSPRSSCRAGCSSDADCMAVEPDLRCLTSSSGTVRACDYSTRSWDPTL
jgi:hypothetical protein